MKLQTPFWVWHGLQFRTERLPCLSYRGRDNFGLNTIPAALSAGGVQSVHTSATWACAVKADSSVSCWGVNRSDQDTPFVALSALGPVKSFHRPNAGYHACVIKLDDTLLCSGYDSALQVSGQPSDLGAVKQVALGNEHTCAITASGQGKCWGNSGYGALTVPSFA